MLKSLNACTCIINVQESDKMFSLDVEVDFFFQFR